MREVAWVREGTRPKTIHRISGWTSNPSEKSGIVMPVARLLVLDEDELGVLLLRCAENGDFAGDTWHATKEDARYQASFEFGETSWVEVDADPAQVDEFAKAYLAKRSAEPVGLTEHSDPDRTRLFTNPTRPISRAFA